MANSYKNLSVGMIVTLKTIPGGGTSWASGRAGEKHRITEIHINDLMKHKLGGAWVSFEEEHSGAWVKQLVEFKEKDMQKFQIGDKVRVKSKRDSFGSGSYVTRELLGTGKVGYVVGYDRHLDRYTVNTSNEARHGDYFGEEDLYRLNDINNPQVNDVVLKGDQEYIVEAVCGNMIGLSINDDRHDFDQGWIHMTDFVEYYSYPQEEPETVELTLEEVAQKVGVDVSKLRIKD